MKNFIRDNSGVIFKFLLTHAVMSILGIMVGLAVLSIEGQNSGFSVIALVASIFTIGFMCFMHYDDMFFAGEKDGIKARAEGEKVDAFKGLKITLVAYSPVILIAVIAIVVNILTLLNVFKTDDVSAITLLLYYAVQGSYISLWYLLDLVGVIGYIIITLIPAIVVSSLGYYLGAKDKTIRGLMGMNVKPPYDGPLERKPKNKDKQ